jgi:hypothetical protein
MNPISLPVFSRPQDAEKRAVTAQLKYAAKTSKADSLLRRFSWEDDRALDSAKSRP